MQPRLQNLSSSIAQSGRRPIVLAHHAPARGERIHCHQVARLRPVRVIVLQALERVCLCRLHLLAESWYACIWQMSHQLRILHA